MLVVRRSGRERFYNTGGVRGVYVVITDYLSGNICIRVITCLFPLFFDRAVPLIFLFEPVSGFRICVGFIPVGLS